MTTQLGDVRSAPRAMLRIEGLVALVASVILYAQTDGSWVLFAILFLTPDLSILGYVRDVRVGAVAYNIAHTYVAPALLVAVTSLGDPQVGLALIWVAHIGFDRLLGYGLKYPTAFGHTHLGPVGKAR